MKKFKGFLDSKWWSLRDLEEDKGISFVINSKIIILCDIEENHYYNNKNESDCVYYRKIFVEGYHDFIRIYSKKKEDIIFEHLDKYLEE